MAKLSPQLTWFCQDPKNLKNLNKNTYVFRFLEFANPKSLKNLYVVRFSGFAKANPNKLVGGPHGVTYQS